MRSGGFMKVFKVGEKANIIDMPEKGKYFEPNFSEKSSNPKGSRCPWSNSVTLTEKILYIESMNLIVKFTAKKIKRW